MPVVAFQDINRCLHFADDWAEEDGEDWDDIYLDDKYKSRSTAKHCNKFGIVEGAHNVRWKEVIIHDKDVTYDKIRVAGWYPGGLTKRPGNQS